MKLPDCYGQASVSDPRCRRCPVLTSCCARRSSTYTHVRLTMPPRRPKVEQTVAPSARTVATMIDRDAWDKMHKALTAHPKLRGVRFLYGDDGHIRAVWANGSAGARFDRVTDEGYRLIVTCPRGKKAAEFVSAAEAEGATVLEFRGGVAWQLKASSYEAAAKVLAAARPSAHIKHQTRQTIVQP